MVKKNILKKLKTLLDQAILISPDRLYANELINMATNNRDDKQFISALQLLLDQSALTKNKCKQRLNASSINLFDNSLSSFSERDLKNIFPSVGAIQMTDGCTGGCAWCGLSAQGYISKKISFKSFESLIDNYGNIFPQRTILYWASDPLDWYEQDKSYLDLARIILKKTDIVLSTVTALPEGTEFTALRFLEFLSERFIKHQLPILNASGKKYFKNPITNHHSVLLRSVSNHQKITSEQMFEHWLLVQKRPLGLKYRFHFSVSQKNIDRIQALFVILKRKVKRKFLESVFLIEKDILGSETILKVGRAFDEFEDQEGVGNFIGIGCFDGILLTPSRVMEIMMTAVTKEFPTGIKTTKIVSEKYRVPRYLQIRDYQTVSIRGAKKLKINILPPFSYDSYKNGIFVKTKFIHDNNIFRDLLAYSLLLQRIIPLLNTILPSLPKKSKDAMKIQFRKELTKRKEKILKTTIKRKPIKGKHKFYQEKIKQILLKINNYLIA